MSASTSEVRSVPLVRRRSREALSALAVVFLLGMGANLIGPPSESGGGVGSAISGLIVALHILIAIGVVVVAVRVRIAAVHESVGQRESLWALVVVSLTFLFGVGTVLTGSEWLSFLMAAGFLAAAALYTRLLVLAPAARAGAR